MPVALLLQPLVATELELMIAALLAGLLAVGSLVALLGFVRARLLARPATAQQSTHSDNGLSYRKVETLLTPTEVVFYATMRPIVEEEGLEILAKVGLEDLIQVTKGVDCQAHRNRIASRRADFVLCNERMTPLLVLQMCEAPLEGAEPAERDEFIERALAAARLPLVWVPTQVTYDAAELATVIHEATAGLGNKSTTSPYASYIPSDPTTPPPQPPSELTPLSWTEPEAGSLNGPNSGAALPALHEAGPSDVIPSSLPLASGDLPVAVQPTATAPFDMEPVHDGPTEGAADADGEPLAPIPLAPEPPLVEDGLPVCPDCGWPLIDMLDQDTNQVVLACPRYPECRYWQAPSPGT